MTENNNIVTFIKAIDKNYYESFLEKGEICLNTIDWFIKHEDVDANIGDSYEGAEFACGKDFTVHIGNPIEECKTDDELNERLKNTKWKCLGKGQNLKGYSKDNNANVFSLYSVLIQNNEKIEGLLVPQKFIDEFSNHRFVLFLKPMVFISKIEAAIEMKLNVNKDRISKGQVTYYQLDERLFDNLTLFHKCDKYIYQNEFRIVVEDDNAKTLILSIGNLNDICTEIDLKKKYSLELIDENNFKLIQLE